MVNKALSKEAIERAVQKTAQEAASKAVKGLLERVKLHEAINNIIETVIPRRYSGVARTKIKARIRENLRRDYSIL